MAKQTDLLQQFGLSRNPFTDRTAERTGCLDNTSLYVHSDLAGFTPSETTYLFFGRRGSGKTTIRMQMQEAYRRFNEEAVASGVSRGHFMVDLCRPGHLTACLRNFQEAVSCTDDNWDACFSDAWHSADMVDCVLAYAATRIVDDLVHGNPAQAKDMLDKIRSDPRAAKQMLLLAHLYAKTDSATLAQLRASLLPPRITLRDASIAVAVTGSLAAGAAVATQDERLASAMQAPVSLAWEHLDRSMPALTRHPRLTGLVLLALGLGGASYYRRYTTQRSLERAAAITRNIRIQKSQPTPVVAGLLDYLFSSQDGVDTIRSMCIGISCHQKLDLLSRLVTLMGYESVAVFGDCFDEVVLLDPVQYPCAIKAFAREVCRNDLLNFGRLHFFFPDSRLALDLNTDRTLKEARFDRHFVRDLTWSRHQLEELAERRFRAAQEEARRVATSNGGGSASSAIAGYMTFNELFKAVKVEDFSSYISKLKTPRELMIMMTEMMSRIESHPDGGLTAQDMEIAVTKALEQAV